jgi:hypothetical protein
MNDIDRVFDSFGLVLVIISLIKGAKDFPGAFPASGINK